MTAKPPSTSAPDMAPEITLRACTADDWPAFIASMVTAFGNEMSPAGRASWERVIDPALMLAAVERDGVRETIVGTAGWLPFDMTVPGGEIPVAAVTMVTVRPTHRRRGILRRMMVRQFEDARAAGVGVAVLWASESVIYQRFGYGLAFQRGRIEIDPRRAAFKDDPGPAGSVRLVDEAEALAIVPAIYEPIRREIPGSFKRSALWWEQRTLSDPEAHRGTGGPIQRLILELDGRPEGYALYRVFSGFGPDSLPTHALEVNEALGSSPAATREVWRYLFSVDLIAKVRTHRLNAEHPLSLMLTDPRQLRMTVGDGTWARLVDVKAALEARRYPADGTLTFEVVDPLCPWNEGVWRLEGGPGGASLTRSAVPAELRLATADLASMYLGTVPCTRLLMAGRVDELAPGAASRADALFRSDVAPWCLDDF
jgi:predicted acetyltransferase